MAADEDLDRRLAEAEHERALHRARVCTYWKLRRRLLQVRRKLADLPERDPARAGYADLAECICDELGKYEQLYGEKADDEKLSRRMERHPRL